LQTAPLLDLSVAGPDAGATAITYEAHRPHEFL